MTLDQLDGSWLLDLVPPETPGAFRPGRARGPMRIEATGGLLRLSGDLYVSRQTGVPAGPPVLGASAGFLVGDNWYPAFAESEYRWYLRSTGVTYDGGTLSFAFGRHLWDAAGQRFVTRDVGTMTLAGPVGPVSPPGAPRPTVQMTGTAMVGGRLHAAAAYKTSPFYRGCLAEVDVMAGRAWPDVAASCDDQQALTFTDVYRRAGMDVIATVDQLDVPGDGSLTIAEMDALLAANRRPSSASNAWRVWLLVGSRMEDGTLGIMFDRSRPPFREGVVGFFDAPLPDQATIEASARGRPLGEAKLAFLRTLVHEAGHAFNLVHPKEDVHGPPVGTTIMNQTGDVMAFSAAANPYPCTALLEFDEHNRTSLIHSPDPQVKPGWKQFGWGHGSFFAGLAEPVDALGLHAPADEAGGLRLSLELPRFAHRGEFVVATVRLTNAGRRSRPVTTALDLARGDTWLHVTTPTGDEADVRDVVRACGPRRVTELAAGESRAAQVELFYTSIGFTFDQQGTYTVHAECVAGEPWEPPLRSAPAELVLRPALADERKIEQRTMDHGVGHAFAFGATRDTNVLETLTDVMDAFPKTTTGAACALVVANSTSAAPDADRALSLAVQNRPLALVAKLCAAVVSPLEPSAPVVDMVRTVVQSAGDSAATQILDEHLQAHDGR